MPVYLAEKISTHPGGAALTASTIRNLGADVSLLAPVGIGAPGKSLRQMLDQSKIHLIEGGNGSARTPELFRYLSAGRQLLQLRRGWQPGVYVDLENQLQRLLGQSNNHPFDCISIVDARPASLTEDDLKHITRCANDFKIPVVFDAAGGNAINTLRNLKTIHPAHLIVNESESKQILDDSPDDHIDRLRSLSAEIAPNILLTLGRNGAVTASPRNHRDDNDNDIESTTNDPPLHQSKIEITPITTPVHALSDRRGVGFVTSGVYSLCVSKAVSAPTDNASFLACSAASAAAANPGPKSISIDDILRLAYHEIATQVADGVEVFERIAREQLPVIDRAARLLLEAYTNGKQVLVIGNGGSAAEANHLVTELTGQFRRKRAALPAISLSSNDALATCIANDYGFEDLFARQIEAFCRPGDVVIAMSTSGKSTNVIRGLQEARKRRANTIGFTGEREGFMRDLCDVLLAVPSRSTPRIQEAHLFVIHVMCEMLDRRVDSTGKLHPSASKI